MLNLKLPNVMLHSSGLLDDWFCPPLNQEVSYDDRGYWRIPWDDFRVVGWGNYKPEKHHHTYFKYLSQLNPDLPVLEWIDTPQPFDYADRSLSIGHTIEALMILANHSEQEGLLKTMNIHIDKEKYLPHYADLSKLFFECMVDHQKHYHKPFLDLLHPDKIGLFNAHFIENHTHHWESAQKIIHMVKQRATKSNSTGEYIGYLQHNCHIILRDLHSFKPSHPLTLEPRIRIFSKGYELEHTDNDFIEVAKAWISHNQDQPHLVVIRSLDIHHLNTFHTLRSISPKTRFFVRSEELMTYRENSHYQSHIDLALMAY